jgi:hypothetical protein
MNKLVKDQQIVDNQMMGKTYYQIKRADLIIVLDTKYNSQYSYLPLTLKTIFKITYVE